MTVGGGPIPGDESIFRRVSFLPPLPAHPETWIRPFDISRFYFHIQKTYHSRLVGGREGNYSLYRTIIARVGVDVLPIRPGEDAAAIGPVHVVTPLKKHPLSNRDGAFRVRTMHFRRQGTIIGSHSPLYSGPSVGRAMSLSEAFWFPILTAATESSPSWKSESDTQKFSHVGAMGF